MTKYVDVPYRRWRTKRTTGYAELVVTKQAQSVLRHIGKARRQGLSVEFDHRIVNEKASGLPEGTAYDVITVTIGKPE